MSLRGLRVLLLEASGVEARLVAELLRSTMADATVTSVVRLSQALTSIADSDFDVALVDLSLPDAVGLESVRALRAAAPRSPSSSSPVWTRTPWPMLR